MFLNKLIKTSFVISVLTVLSLNTMVSAQTPPPKVCSWNGTWETNNGRLILEENGDEVKGNFVGHSDMFEGVVSGRFIIGAWAAGTRSGNLNMIMSPDCRTFTGDRKTGMNKSPFWDINSFTGTRTNISYRPTNNYRPNNYSAGQTYTIGGKRITLNLGSEWILKNEPDGTIMVTSRRYPDSMVFFIGKDFYPYYSQAEKDMFLQGQQEEAEKSASGPIEVAYRTIFGKNVNIIKVPQDDITSNIFFPDTGNGFYMMTATYQDTQNMDIAESLITIIVGALFSAK